MAEKIKQGTSNESPFDDGDSSQKRERSSIAFPYSHLDNAVEMAKAIHDNVGHGSCDDDQLAAWLHLSPKSSGFRVQLSAARMFGVIETSSDYKHSLSALGRSIIDPKQARASRAEALLNVPLYAAIYNKYKGTVLPPVAALERDMVGLGVAEKQKERARQIFNSSAEQAGYFESGRERLVRPGVVSAPAANGKPADGGGGGGGNGAGPDDPLIKALIQKLPSKGPWTAEERMAWLQLMIMAFQVSYGPVESLEIKKGGN